MIARMITMGCKHNQITIFYLSSRAEQPRQRRAAPPGGWWGMRSPEAGPETIPTPGVATATKP